MKRLASAFVLSVALFVIIRCGKTASSGADTHAFEETLAALGGATSSTFTDSVAMNFRRPGFFEMEKSAWGAAGLCPTSLNANSGACSVAGNSMTLTFPSNGCAYNTGGLPPIWFGGTVLTTDNPPACGTYPTLDGVDYSQLTRTYLNSLLSTPTIIQLPNGAFEVADTSSPSAATFVAANSTSATGGTGGILYNLTSNLGYARTWTFGGTTHTLSMGVRAVLFSTVQATLGTALYDHTISTTDINGTNTPLNITLTGTGYNTVQSVNGTLYIQRNIEGLYAQAYLSNIQYVTGSCFPSGGTVTFVQDGYKLAIQFTGETKTTGAYGGTDASGANLSGNLHCL